MTLKELIEDINFLFETLQVSHKDIYKLITKERYQKIKENMLSELDSDLTIGQFELSLMLLFSELKDTHTQIYVSVKKLPISFEWLSDGYYAIVVPSDMSAVFGKKLVSVNSIPIETFSLSAQKYLIFDNAEAEKVDQSFALHNYELIKVITKSKEQQVRYEFDDNFVINLTFNENSEPVSQISLTRYCSVNLPFLFAKTNYEVRLTDNTLVFRYSKCREDIKYPLTQLYEDINKLLDSKPHKIVVDLRNNTGGNSSLLGPILKSLIEYSNIYDPKIYTLINRRIFSSGALNTYDLKFKLKSILVGQPTSQGGNHFGEVKTFELPNSKIKVNYSTKYFKLVDDNTTTIQPDINIEPTIQELMIGKDSVLDYVLNQ